MPQNSLQAPPETTFRVLPAIRRSPAQRRELEDQITELAAHIHAATYRLLELIAEFDLCEGWGGEGLRSCAHWLNWRCGIALGAAREKVRVAHALRELPQLSAEFRAGAVSYSKVRAITRVATPANEGYLLDIARHGTAAHVERLVRQYRQVKRIEALELDNQRHGFRELNWRVDESGMWQLSARLTPEQGALVQQRLEAAMAELAEERCGCPEGTGVADAGEEDYTQPAPSTPIAQRRADALVRLAEGGVSGGNAGGADAHLVHLHTSSEVLNKDGEGAQSELHGAAPGCHGHGSAETSRRLSCDAGVVHWLNDKGGNTLNIGRKTRSVPPSMRRALQRRDGGCRFPGCTASRFVDAHHITHWADGGATSVDNLVLLCRHHHRLVHEGGFGLSRGGGGQLRFTNPQGIELPPNGEKRSRGNVLHLFAANRRVNPNIGPHTGACRWQGEKMDDDLAVYGLLIRE